MVKINSSEEYMTVDINEARKENGEEWDKVVILRFPTAEFTFEQATEIATKATTVEHVSKDKVTTYYVSGIVDTKANDYFIDIWLKNPEVMVEDNLATKVQELEQIVNGLLEQIEEIKAE